ncbi:gamma-aminobutyric acid type B receptor subunit 1-like [Gigantopelta aegis]|uniref:gamma-aminobutyric acid type B receptor subunit 1-like n=1 Tax=Gigantopelta aegis TaxID=1735272 RepID=UPI001B887BFE|nr:gamma-aminobutyric acid type B receptor subunit 1-like [Gigantopelta aegis]
MTYDCDPGTSLDALYHHIYTPPTKIMVIGGSCSPVSEATAQVSHRWNLVQISPVSVSPALSNRFRFKRFFRLNSPDNDVNPARIEIFKQFGWTKIATLHQALELFSEPTYNLFSIMKNASMTVFRSEIITNGLSHQVQQLKDNEARIIVGSFFEDIAQKVFCEAYKIGFYGPKIVWILIGWYSVDWWRNVPSTLGCTPEQLLVAFDGYFSVGRVWFNPKNDLAISGYTPTDIQSMYYNITGKKHEPVYGLRQGLIGYDSVWTATLAINKTIGDLEERGGSQTIDDFTYWDDSIGQMLFDNMKKTDFYATKGRITFNEKGDPITIFQIERFQNGKKEVVGLYDPNLQTDIKIQWLTNTTPILWKGGRIPKDSVTVIPRTETLSPAIYISMSCLAGLGAIVTCGFLAFNIVFRKIKIVKRSSPNLNNLTLAGCLLLFCTVFLETAEDQSVVTVCKSKIVLLTVGFSLAFGALFAKTWRVYLIFTHGTKQRKVVKDFKLISTVFSLVAVNVVVIGIWFVVDPQSLVLVHLPSQVNHEEDIEIKRKIEKCESPNQIYFVTSLLALQGILLLFGTFLAIQTRKVNVEGLNDSRMIGLCIYNVVVLSFLGVTIEFALKHDVNLHYGMTTVITILATTITQCLIFVPKVRRHNRASNYF